MKKFLNSDVSEDYTNFVVDYSNYLSEGIINKRFDDKSILYMRTGILDELKSSKFIYAQRTNCFSQSGYDQWLLNTEDHYMLIRFATGLIMLAKTDRQLKLNYTNFQTVGICLPPSHDIIYGIQNFKQLAGMMGINIPDDIELDWS